MIKAKDNPFRTDRVESLLTFQPEWLGETWDSIFERWKTLGRFTTVVGPHGSGKTTFLESFAPRLQQRGYQVHSVTIRSPNDNLVPIPTGSVVLLDAGGLRQGIGWRRGIAGKIRRQIERQLSGCCGLIETRHRRGLRPTLLRTRTTTGILAKCIQRLDSEHTHSEQEIAKLFRRHRGNIRIALRDCYDQVAGRS